MTIEVDTPDTERIYSMRHISPLGLVQIVWRTRAIRNAENYIRAIRNTQIQLKKLFRAA